MIELVLDRGVHLKEKTFAIHLRVADTADFMESCGGDDGIQELEFLTREKEVRLSGGGGADGDKWPLTGSVGRSGGRSRTAADSFRVGVRWIEDMGTSSIWFAPDIIQTLIFLQLSEEKTGAPECLR